MKRWIAVMFVLLVGCGGMPKPLEPGQKVLTPWQCEELRRRGGEC